MFENRKKREKKSVGNPWLNKLCERKLLVLTFFFPSIFFFFSQILHDNVCFNVFLKSFAQEIGAKPNKINTFSMLNFCCSEVNRRSTQRQSPPYDPLWRTRFLSSSFDHNKINNTLLYSKTVYSIFIIL